ncbi:hypothetical protein OIU34_02380 [Pararhizobium sp. BT-229]|uniref:hypothetical protein n=1 Tax=Pararhizobium sp. BT-229 TaxID=2986923 RepID=UPI0021F74AF2|nr:hypothetical protein [Pararhizobium sp. BT-229]MCV9960734.1 hypothetical protein [Pararhizobium sp. BT-229]
MATFDTFDREIRLATAGLEPRAVNRALADFARAELRKVQAAGASRNYQLYVNGRPALSEYDVEAPGPIVYQFSMWNEIIAYALSELQRRSPVRTGRFRNSFIVIIDGAIVASTKTIPATAEVIITNFQPYIRKAEAGLLGTKRFAIFDGTKRALTRRFGNEGRTSFGYLFETKWLNIGPGVHGDIPYILKRSQGRRKDRQAGMPISYPAVIMTMVT